MLKNTTYIRCIFFAIDDVIVTSVNTYASMMGISTEVKYRGTWSNLFEKIRNMEQIDCLNVSQQKLESW